MLTLEICRRNACHCRKIKLSVIGSVPVSLRKSITADINWSIGYTVFYKAYSTVGMVKMTMGKHYCIKRMKIYAELFGVFQTFSCACGIEKYLFSAELNVERKTKIG